MRVDLELKVRFPINSLDGCIKQASKIHDNIHPTFATTGNYQHVVHKRDCTHEQRASSFPQLHIERPYLIVYHL